MHGANRLIFSLLLFSSAITLTALYLNTQDVSATLQNRSLDLQNAQPSEVTNYSFDFTFGDSDPVGSITFEVCNNYLFPGTVCEPPDGFSFSSASLVDQSGEIGFSVDNTTADNELLLYRDSEAITNYESSYNIGDVINPQETGSYYVKISTYGSNDGTGAAINEAILVFSINRDLVISTEVPPFLKFCVAVNISGFNCATAQGNLLNLGELTPNNTTTATSQMLIATNAGSGYSITVTGTTMTSGNNTISSINNQSSSPGTSQFGVNLRQNTVPNVGRDPEGPGTASPTNDYSASNTYSFNSNDTVASSSDPDNYRKFTKSYIVNIAEDQPPGVYTTTVNYIALANF